MDLRFGTWNIRRMYRAVVWNLFLIVKKPGRFRLENLIFLRISLLLLIKT
jgi:hypothetical protein